MICPKCREQDHISCPGGTWCDCGHRVKVTQLQVWSPAVSGFVGPDRPPAKRTRKATPRRPKP